PRELLDLVDHLAAAVVALAGVALGVLVRGNRADRLQGPRPRRVAGRHHLDLAPLPLELLRQQLRDLGVDLRETRLLQLLEGLVRNRHAWIVLRASAAETAPSRSTRGSAAVRSITVDATPASAPRSS